MDLNLPCTHVVNEDTTACQGEVPQVPPGGVQTGDREGALAVSGDTKSPLRGYLGSRRIGASAELDSP